MNHHLLILGAGQYGAIVKEIANSMECSGKIAFLDDSFGSDDNPYGGDRIGKISDYEKFVTGFSCAISSVGNAAL